LSISDLLKFGVRKTEEQPGAAGDTAAPKGPETVVTSKALPKFINALSHHESPVLVDFGPVIGTNVAFFGDIVGNVTKMVATLGSNGVAGLVAVAIILYLFMRK